MIKVALLEILDSMIEEVGMDNDNRTAIVENYCERIALMFEEGCFEDIEEEDDDIWCDTHEQWID